MSISAQHGTKGKRSSNNNSNGGGGKKNLSTAAVYPIQQQQQQQQQQARQKQQVKAPSAAAAADVAATAVCVRGQRVRGARVATPTIVTSLSELVSEVIPQSGAQPASQNREPICWIECQAGDPRSRSFAIVLGLARGYQIWMVMENGDCEEVVSERKGPLRVGRLLPAAEGECTDTFRDARPLFALVDGNPMSSSAENSQTVKFLSLKSGQMVHTLAFTSAVVEIESTPLCVLVVLADGQLHLYDYGTLGERQCGVKLPAPLDAGPPCFAVSGNLLAFPERQLNPALQSCGGSVAVEQAELSYSGQVISAAKTISKSIADSLATSKPHAGKDHHSSSGIVTVVDISAQPAKGDARRAYAHFVAHCDSPVGHLAFGRGGQLLLSGTPSSELFHLFVIHAHPTSCRLTAVQHVYSLVRGNSAARVIHSAFSADNRWLAISTNHGTTHLFAIAPHGGPVTVRTHCGKFVNKETSFERTAGLQSLGAAEHRACAGAANGGGKDEPAAYREHPSIGAGATMSRTVVNPRLTYYAPPLVLCSLVKIKQRPFSTENLSAWASDNAPSLLATRPHKAVASAGSRLASSWRRLAVRFGASGGGGAPCLFVMNADGLLTQYGVEVRRERHNSSGSTSSPNVSEAPCSSSPGAFGIHASMAAASVDAPIRAKVDALVQWELTRNGGASGVEVIDPPLSAGNPLLRACVGHADKKTPKAVEANAQWLHQIEAATYLGPYRRLWAGPQFSFGVYAAPSGHNSEQLFNPNAAAAENSFNASHKCCPVLIEKAIDALNGDVSSALNLSAASKIVCGSWSSDFDAKTFNNDERTYTAVKEKIEDAMREEDE